MKNLIVFLLILLSSQSKGVLKRDLQNMTAEFLDPVNEPKLKMIAKEWNKGKVYENHFPSSGPVNLFQNLQTLEFTWVDPENLMKDYEDEKAVFENIFQDIQNISWDDLFDSFEGLSCIPMQLRRSSFVEQLMFKVAENIKVNITNTLGHTPLMLAAGCDGRSVAKLLQRDAQMETIDVFGFSALHHAVYFGIESSVEVLLQKGAQVNAEDPNNAPLINAIKNVEIPNANVVKILLNYGASIDIKDRYGKTPLELAKLYLDEDDERIAILQKAEKTKKKPRKLQQMFREFAEIKQYRVAQYICLREAEGKSITTFLNKTYTPPKRNQPTSQISNLMVKQPRPRTNKGTGIKK